jgi:hypothetical protein
MRVFSRLRVGFGMARRSGGLLRARSKLRAFSLFGWNALSGVAKTAPYVSATEHTAPEYFDDMDL